jgi:hypothetical protein
MYQIALLGILTFSKKLKALDALVDLGNLATFPINERNILFVAL